MTIRILIAVSLAWTSTCLFGSDGTIKFGKIAPEDFEVTYAHLDSAASAVIIYHGGNTQMIYDASHRRFRSLIKVHKRLKILDKDALDLGNVTISLYRNGNGSDEDLRVYKGYTFILNQGKVEEHKLSKENVFRESVSDNINEVRLSFPNVQEGSILDLYYEIESDFIFSLPAWRFQSSYPTLISEYSIHYPEYFDYSVVKKGYAKVDLIENKVTNEQVNYVNDAIKIINKAFQGRDLAPFKSEAYMTAESNFIASVQFEIRSTHFPNQTTESYTQTWESIDQLLLEDEDFGLQLKRGNVVKDAAKALSAITDPMEQIQAAYRQVKDNITWDGNNGFYCRDGLKKVLDNHTGNAAEKNMLLVLLLKELGQEAFPVILSTRSHGYLLSYNPSLESFNYVIAGVKLGDQIIQLDASDPDLSFGTLPIECFNGQGRIIDEKLQGWIDLLPHETRKTRIVYDMTLNPESLDLTGKIQDNCFGYSALDLKKDFESFPSKDDFLKELSQDHNGLEIMDADLQGLDKDLNTLAFNYQVNYHEQIEDAGDLYLLYPMFYEATQHNPFNLEKRDYPVDFGVGIHEAIITKLTLPDGFHFEALPDPTIVNLFEDKGKFSYSIQKANDHVVVFTSKIDINETLFLPEEYQILKEFWNHIIQKHAEPVAFAKD